MGVMLVQNTLMPLVRERLACNCDLLTFVNCSYMFIPGIGSKSCEKVGSCGPGAPKMKPSLVEEEDDDMPDSGSMKSLSQVSEMQSRTQRQPSEDVGKSSSRAACDAIQGVAFGTATEVEVRIEDSSDVDDEVLKEKSMHLPMRCNYFEATDRLPTLAPRKTQATQSSWDSEGSEDIGEEKKVTFSDAQDANKGKKAATAANAVKLPTQKNHTHSSYASLPQGQSIGLSAEGNEFEVWDETWGIASSPSKHSKHSEGKHPTESEHCNLELMSQKSKGRCGRLASLCARHRRKCCCCGVSLGSLLLFSLAFFDFVAHSEKTLLSCKRCQFDRKEGLQSYKGQNMFKV